MANTTKKERKCIRYLAREMAMEDRLIFQIELMLDEELSTLFYELKEAWELYPTQLTTPKKESLFSIKTKPKSKIYALVAVLILLVLGSFYFLKPPLNQMQSVSAHEGERKTVVLPDSSVVILNAGSSINYPRDFENIREVFLAGEAYFQVQKDISHPFVVHSGELNIRVLGTAFSVNNYSDLNMVSLKEGKVEVVLKENQDKITLNPSEQLLWNVQSKEVSKRNFDIPSELAWKDDVLFFKNIQFGEALPKINRFYGVNFKIENPAILKKHITGSFENQNLEEFIAALEYIASVKIVQQEKKQFLISPLQHD